MAGIALIAALGIFAVGIVVGVVAMVSHGVSREQRRHREDYGSYGGPQGPGGYFLAEQAPDAVSYAARRVNGLYVRRLPPAARYDDQMAA